MASASCVLRSIRFLKISGTLLSPKNGLENFGQERAIYCFYIARNQKENLDRNRCQDLAVIYVPSAYDQDGTAISRHLQERGYRFKNTIELDSFTAARTFCSHGLGIAVLPEKLAKISVEDERIIPVKLEGFPATGFGHHRIFATQLSSRCDDPRIKLIIKNLRQWFAN